MSSQGRDGGRAREQDELCGYGLERDPRADHAHELELAERLAEQASLSPGDPAVGRLAHYRLGRGPSPFERPGTAAAPSVRLTPGEEVTYRGEDGAGPARHGTVRRLLDEDGAAVVAFHGGGETAVSAEALERRAA
jgi:dipeptidyl aminopeptidase/acylaminoacyl peptidase